MKSLVVLCGPPYSGKSSFGESIDKYVHHDIDAAYELMAIKRRDLFMDLLKKYNKDIHKKVRKVAKDLGVKNSNKSKS